MSWIFGYLIGGLLLLYLAFQIGIWRWIYRAARRHGFSRRASFHLGARAANGVLGKEWYDHLMQEPVAEVEHELHAFPPLEEDRRRGS